MDNLEWIVVGVLFAAIWEFGAHCAVEHYGILQSNAMRPVRYVIGVLGIAIPFTAWALIASRQDAVAALWAMIVAAGIGTGFGYWVDGVREGERREADLNDIGFPTEG